MLFCPHQINGKCHCDCHSDTKEITPAEDGVLEMFGLVGLNKSHQRLVIKYEGLEGLSYFIGGDFNHYPL